MEPISSSNREGSPWRYGQLSRQPSPYTNRENVDSIQDSFRKSLSANSLSSSGSQAGVSSTTLASKPETAAPLSGCHLDSPKILQRLPPLHLYQAMLSNSSQDTITTLKHHLYRELLTLQGIEPADKVRALLPLCLSAPEILKTMNLSPMSMEEIFPPFFQIYQHLRDAKQSCFSVAHPILQHLSPSLQNIHSLTKYQWDFLKTMHTSKETTFCKKTAHLIETVLQDPSFEAWPNLTSPLQELRQNYLEQDEIFTTFSLQPLHQQHAASLIGHKIGFRLITKETLDGMFARNADGSVMRSPTQGEGSSLIIRWKGNFLKQDSGNIECPAPRNPGKEYQYFSLAKLLFGRGAPPTELIKILIHSDQSTHIFNASQGIPGSSLAYHLSPDYSRPIAKEDFDQFFKQLDLNSAWEQLILQLLTRPQDAKLDNFAVRLNDNGLFSIESIDNEEIFENIVFKENEEHFVHVRCVLFFWNELVNTSIPKAIREKILSINPYTLILEWLLDLYEQNIKYLQLNQEGFFNANELCNMHLPIRLLPDTASDLLQKLLNIQECLSKENVTFQEIFNRVSPQLSHYVQAVSRKHPNPKDAILYVFEKLVNFKKERVPLLPYERELPAHELDSIKVIESFHEKDQMVKREITLRQWLQRQNASVNAAQENLNITPLQACENLMDNHINFGLIAHIKHRLELLEILQQIPFERLTFRSCQDLTFNYLEKLIKHNSRLRLLKLRQCSKIDKTIAGIVLEGRPDGNLVLDCPGIFTLADRQQLESKFNISDLERILPSLYKPASSLRKTNYSAQSSDEFQEYPQDSPVNTLKEYFRKINSLAQNNCVIELEGLWEKIKQEFPKDLIKEELKSLTSFYPLHWAVENNSCILLKEFFSLNPDLQARDASGNHPFHTAAKVGSANMMLELIKLRFPTSVRDKEGRTPLIILCQSFHLAAVRLLLESSNQVLEELESGFPLLAMIESPQAHRVTSTTRKELVTLLLDKGVKLSGKHESKLQASQKTHLVTSYNYLHRAMMQGFAEIAELLMARNEKLMDETTSNGESALHFLARCDAYVGLKLLNRIYRHAPQQIDHADNGGITPLMTIIISQKLSLLPGFLTLKPNLTLRDARGYTAVHYAVCQGNFNAFNMLKKADETAFKTICLDINQPFSPFDLACKFFCITPTDNSREILITLMNLGFPLARVKENGYCFEWLQWLKSHFESEHGKKILSYISSHATQSFAEMIGLTNHHMDAIIISVIKKAKLNLPNKEIWLLFEKLHFLGYFEERDICYDQWGIHSKANPETAFGNLTLTNPHSNEAMPLLFYLVDRCRFEPLAERTTWLKLLEWTLQRLVYIVNMRHPLDGDSLLHKAADARLIDVIKLLLRFAANPHNSNFKKISPIDCVEKDFQALHVPLLERAVKQSKDRFNAMMSEKQKAHPASSPVSCEKEVILSILTNLKDSINPLLTSGNSDGGELQMLSDVLEDYIAICKIRDLLSPPT